MDITQTPGTDNGATQLSPESADRLFSLAEDADVSLCILTDTLYGLSSEGKAADRDESTTNAVRELTDLATTVVRLVREARAAGLVDFELAVAEGDATTERRIT